MKLFNPISKLPLLARVTAAFWGSSLGFASCPSGKIGTATGSDIDRSMKIAILLSRLWAGGGALVNRFLSFCSSLAAASAFSFSLFFRSFASRFSFFRFFALASSQPGEWHIDDASEPSSSAPNSCGTMSPLDLIIYFVVVPLLETLAGGIETDNVGVVIVRPLCCNVGGR
jgi:hypothetical protein